MNVLPKVWNFVWRACKDILPTRANLYRKKIHTDPLCTICALGVSHGHKCVGNDTRKAAEMRSSGAEFLPFDSAVGGKAHRGGNGDLGDSGLVHLERQEQVLF